MSDVAGDLKAELARICAEELDHLIVSDRIRDAIVYAFWAGAASMGRCTEVCSRPLDPWLKSQNPLLLGPGLERTAKLAIELMKHVNEQRVGSTAKLATHRRSKQNETKH